VCVHDARFIGGTGLLYLQYKFKLFKSMTDVILDITDKAIHWNSDKKQFSVELSDLEKILQAKVINCCNNRIPIRLKNPKTKTSCMITFVKADMDGSQEDIYGWNYKGNAKHSFTFLFIND
jgi:hypothetical protein